MNIILNATIQFINNLHIIQKLNEFYLKILGFIWGNDGKFTIFIIKIDILIDAWITFSANKLHFSQARLINNVCILVHKYNRYTVTLKKSRYISEGYEKHKNSKIPATVSKFSKNQGNDDNSPGSRQNINVTHNRFINFH